MKIILVSHGSYSKGLLESVQMIVGKQENIVAYGLYPEESPASLTEILESEVKELDEEVLFMTDLFHGSPFNIVVSLMRNYDIYHVTGVNLPILLEAIMARNSGSSAQDVCKKLMEMESDTIKDVRKCLFEEVDK